MRRDLAYFYPLPVNQVFDAFYRAANQKFGKQCKADPFKTIQFALNYSFKYNMNGGSITAHFMPYQNGTAVNLRYTIVQAFGARYQAHARDYTQFADGLLHTTGKPANINIQQFLDYEARTPSNMPAQGQPPMQQAPQQQMPQQPMQGQQPMQRPVQQPAPQQGMGNSFCTKCGAPLAQNANFCVKCGNKIN